MRIPITYNTNLYIILITKKSVMISQLQIITDIGYFR